MKTPFSACLTACFFCLALPASAAVLNVDFGTKLQGSEMTTPISGTETIEKTGAGTYVIDLVNTTSGKTTISAGTLQIGNGTTAPTIGSSVIDMASGTRLFFNYGTQKNIPAVTVNITGTATLKQENTASANNYLGSNALKIAGTNSTLYLQGTSGTSNNYAFYGPNLSGLTNSRIELSTTMGISGQTNLGSAGSGNVLVMDGARLSSAGANAVGTFENAIMMKNVTRSTSTIAAGWGTSNQFTFNGSITDFAADTSGTLVLGSGVINLNGTVNSSVVLSLALASDGRTTLGSSTANAMRWGGLTGNGRFDVTSAAAKPVTLETKANATYSGVISGNVNLTKSGTAAQEFSAVQNYSGTTTVSGGTLKLTAADAIAASSAVTVNATLDAASTASQTLANLSGSGIVTHSGTGSAAVTIRSSVDSSFSGEITNGAGTVSLTKTGAKTLTLSGTNTYSGATAVTEGTFKIASSGSVTSNVTVNEGAALILCGDVTGNLNENGLFLLDFTDGAVQAGSVSGTAAFGDSALLGIVSDEFTLNDSYSFQANSISYGSRSFAELYADSVAAGTLGDFWTATVTGNSFLLSVDSSKVPEPASWLLLVWGLGLLAWRKAACSVSA